MVPEATAAGHWINIPADEIIGANTRLALVSQDN